MNVKLSAVAIAGLAAGGLLAAILIAPPDLVGPSGGRTSGEIAATGTALVGGPFTLTDHTGKRVTERDFQGRFLLVFFGFTFCPDICPSGLSVIAAALDKLGPEAQKLTPVFVTIDPERDTVQKLAPYVTSFHPRLVGLTGAREEVAAIVKAYRVFAKKVPNEKNPADYTMDHSSIVYLMGPDGRYRAIFPELTKPELLAEQIGKALRRG